MTNNMVKKLLIFSQGNVKVEIQGNPKASECSRKGFLKTLALAAIIASGVFSMPEQASADSLQVDPKITKEETDISFSAYQKDAVQLERERALRDYEAKKAQQRAYEAEKAQRAYEAEKAQQEHEIAKWKHDVAKWEHEQKQRQLVVIVQPHVNNNHYNNYNNRDRHLGYRSQPRYNGFTVTDLEFDRNGHVKKFAFTGTPPSRAMCASVANTPLSAVDSIARRVQRQEGMNRQEREIFGVNLKGLIIYCSAVNQVDPNPTFIRQHRFPSFN